MKKVIEIKKIGVPHSESLKAAERLLGLLKVSTPLKTQRDKRVLKKHVARKFG